MPTRAGLSPDIASLLRCPAAGHQLSLVDGELRCADESHRYPLVEGVPCLIDSSASVFATTAIDGLRSSPNASRSSRLTQGIRALLPSPSLNVAARRNFRRLADLLDAGSAGGETVAGTSTVLVVGGAIEGEGFAELRRADRLLLVETDVVVGPRTQVICDAHRLPFASGSFDAVVCQAVLEHVLDPGVVVAEMHRVLKPGGLIYTEIPFMQQVHAGAFDFTRYTLSGHRRLMRDFDEINAGVACGPATALVWSFGHFARSLGGSSRLRREFLAAAATIMTFWIKYLDRWLADRPAAIDAASATYFLGSRSDSPREDRAIIDSYRGAGRASGL